MAVRFGEDRQGGGGFEALQGSVGRGEAQVLRARGQRCACGLLIPEAIEDTWPSSLVYVYACYICITHVYPIYSKSHN